MPEVDLFFAHDSTLVPLVASMGLLEGLGPVAEASRAAYHCPFASRLVVTLDDTGSVEVEYNDAVLLRLPAAAATDDPLAGVREWDRRFGWAADVNVTDMCQRQAAS